MSGKSLLALATTLAFLFCALFLACQNDDDDDSSSGDDNDDDQSDDDAQLDDDQIDDDQTNNEAQNVTDSGCINPYKTIHDDYTYDDELKLNWDGAGTISVYHGHTCKNCVFELHATYSVANGVIAVMEESQDDFMAAACMCLFEFTYDLTDIAAGDYQFEVYNLYHDEFSSPSLKWQVSVSLVDGQPDEFTFSEYHEAGCG